MSDEIDDFIRKVQERRRQGKGQPRRPAAPRPAEPPPPAPPPAAPRTLVQRPEVVEAEIVGDDLLVEISRSHIDTHEFQERASRLGEELGLTDERLEARLHGTFDHQIGELSRTQQKLLDSAATVTPGRPENEVALLLRSPKNLRQAIILSEILNRPEHRW